jgi:hypothetical protein
MAADVDIIQSFGTAGVMIYGEAPHDSSSETQCLATKNYVETTLGPQLLKSQRAAKACRSQKCSGNGNCARAIEFDAMAPKDTCCICDSGFSGASCEQLIEDDSGPHKANLSPALNTGQRDTLYINATNPITFLAN